MTDFEAYKLYISIKNHFTIDSYDFFKYNGKNKLTVSSFQKRKDKIFFLKLAKHSELQDFLVANFSINPKAWVKELAYGPEAEKNYKDWLKKQQSFSYIFKQEIKKLEYSFNDLFIVHKNQHPLLLKSYLQKDISLETFCLLLKYSNCFKHWDIQLCDDPIWNSTRKLVLKYTPFIKIDDYKMREICIQNFNPV